jgi:hypothetical protein
MHRSDHFPNYPSPFVYIPRSPYPYPASRLLEGIGSSSPISEEQREAYCLEDWEIVSDCWGDAGNFGSLPRASAPTATVSRGRFSVNIWAMN